MHSKPSGRTTARASGPSDFDRRANEILGAALDLAADERPAFLDNACASDSALRSTVDELLLLAEASDNLLPSGGVLESPWAKGLVAEESLAGQALGDYRLREVIGQGGMGQVYRAERADGQYDHEVAIKVIRASSNAYSKRRFFLERQILARLRHPNICRLLDGGLMDDGRPFLVMEYLQGQPITTYCQHQGLGLGQRLELFCAVGRAVQAAHRSLVVHRDLKPANILVTAEREVKLLDFGIAKLLDAADYAADATRTVGRVLTPQYASPEQFRGEPVTVASDVYQLGFILYELLAGHRPYATQSLTPAQQEELICARQPLSPSVAVGGGATPSTRRRLARELAGDLDTITLKCLRKQPANRYPSVGELLEDIERYLEGRPIAARPATWAYRAGKFVRRHRPMVGLGASALALIAALTLAYTLRLAGERNRAEDEALRAHEATADAERAAREAEQVVDYLIELIEASDPAQALGKPMSLRETVDRSAHRIRETLADHPTARARLEQAIGRVQSNLGDLDLAEQALRASLEAAGPTAAESARTSIFLSEVLARKRQTREAEQLARDALRTLTRGGDEGLDEPLIPRAQLAIATALWRRTEYAEADLWSGRALAEFETRFGSQSPELIAPLRMVGVTQSALGRHEASLRAWERGLDLARQHLDPLHPMTIRLTGNIVVYHLVHGRPRAAKDLQIQVVQAQEAVFGTDHLDTASAYNNYGSILLLQGKTREALEFFDKALRIYVDKLGRSSTGLKLVLFKQIETKRLLRRFEEAKAILRWVEEIRRQQAEAHIEDAYLDQAQANLHRDLQEPAQAHRLYARSLAKLAAMDSDPVNLAEARADLGELLRRSGRQQEAAEIFVDSLALLAGVRRIPALVGLRDIRSSQNRCDEALELHLEARRLRDDELAPEHAYWQRLETAPPCRAALDSAQG
ncbi:MAG: serine/threonine-protein kinase [Acidobacteriota bacterium]